MSHEVHDAVGLELARRIAEGLLENPQWIEDARKNLLRWSASNADSPRLLQCYDAWLKVLELPVLEVRRILMMETDEGQQLRQNSPFVGMLTPAEVWGIKRRIHDRYKSTDG